MSQQPKRFKKPPSPPPSPPPLSADPHYLHHHQRPPRHPGPWFSNQFQYRPSHPLSPPPPRQWRPHSDHLNPYQFSGYTPPPPPHYSHPYQNQFHLPPSPYSPPPLHRHSQFPHGYSQEWGNPSRGHHQAYPALDNQHQQSQFLQSPYVHQQLTGDSNAPFSHQEALQSPYVHQQVVPSSYSSVTDKEQFGYQNENSYSSMPFPTSSHTWPPPVAPSYSPIPPVLPSGPRDVSSIAVPSPVPVHTGPPFGGFPGPSFQPTVSSAGMPYVLGAGNAFHPTTAFPGDASGISGVSECPKKTPVPKWPREEIIKKKALVTSSSQEHLKEKTPPSIEEEGVDRFTVKRDQGDSKSIESSRSTEEDDDEANVEAARTAAINSKIKSILAEVLSKATDELFDEIATKVVSEDVDHKTAMTNLETSTSPPAVPTAKGSAKVLIPPQAKEINTQIVSGKSNSGSLVDVLNLAHYASSEDNEEDEIKSSSKPKSRTNPVHMQSGIERLSEVQKNTMGASKRTNLIESNNNQSGVRDTRELDKNCSVDAVHSSEISENKDNKNNVDGKMMKDTNRSSFKDTVEEKVIMKFERPSWNSDVKKLPTEDPLGKETRIKPDKHGRHESKRSSSRNDLKETESGNIRPDEKGEENHRRQDEKHITKDLADDLNGSKHRMKEQGVWTEKKAKHSYSRKWSTHHSVKEERKETERPHMTCAKEDDNKKRERTKDGEDRDRMKEEGVWTGKKAKHSYSRKWSTHHSVKEERKETERPHMTCAKEDDNKKRERTKDGEDRDRMKEEDVWTGKKAKHSYSRKWSTHHRVKEERKETERPHMTCAKEDDNKKRERTKDGEDRLRHKIDSSREKRRCSSSVSSWGRNSKADQTNVSNNETSEDSRRKLHTRKHNLAPLPIRLRRQVSQAPYYKHSQFRHPPYSSHENTRQVSRPPYYKHSQCRHSPYSSRENTRRRRSRSRSPVRQQR